jgi:hypothetical protein
MQRCKKHSATHKLTNKKQKKKKQISILFPSKRFNFPTQLLLYAGILTGQTFAFNVPRTRENQRISSPPSWPHPNILPKRRLALISPCRIIGCKFKFPSLQQALNCSRRPCHCPTAVLTQSISCHRSNSASKLEC